MKRFLSLIIFIIVLCSCAPTTSCSDESNQSCTRILFIGNSYTFVNDLPNTFAKLAKSGGHKAEVGMAAQGGWRLADHLQSADTLHLLASKKWDFVVLQEQSQIPSVEPARSQEMYPAARRLVEKVRGIGAMPVFFDTWAHRDGWPEYGMNNYASMQAAIDTGYTGIAQELNVTLAPVGFVWFTAVQQHPELKLWQDDGSHPTEQGTYLAACVFYAVIFQESPTGMAYRGSLSKETAQTLQTLASKTVLNVP